MRLIGFIARALVLALAVLGCGCLGRTLASKPTAFPAASVTVSSTPAPAIPTVYHAAAVIAVHAVPTAAATRVLLAPTPAREQLAMESAVPPQPVAPAALTPEPPPTTVVPVAATPPAQVPATATPVVVAVAPHVLMLAPHDPPQILDAWISTNEIYAGETVFGRVLASSNVASVEARVEGYSWSLPKTGVGEFSLAYKVPVIPWFLHRTYALRLIARNVDGVQATRSLPVTLR